MSDLAKKIEAVLFISGAPLTVPQLATLLTTSDELISEALKKIEEHYKDSHFLAVFHDGDMVGLVSSPEVSSLVEEFAKEEFKGELTKAALETLSVIAYRGPLRRSDIDYIRGVNSSFMIRHLLVRGLIERTRDPKDSRSFLYRVSSDFLKFLGVISITDLPHYGSFAQKLDEFIIESQKQSDATGTLV